MKKYLLLLTLLISSISCFGQYKNQSRVQSANEYALNKQFLGITFKGEYFPFERFSVNPQVTFFLPATGTATAFDVNGRYYLTDDRLQVYGLLGYSFYTRNYEFNPLGRIYEHSVNVGLGTLFKLSQELGLNAEFRVPVPRQEMILSLGVVYFIN
jgi:hypothetical protein